MGILSIKVDAAGLVGVTPKVVYIETDDLLSAIETAGYLNTLVNKDGISLNDKSMALVSYKESAGALANLVAWFQVKKIGNDWSLVAHASSEFPILIGPDEDYTTVKQAIDDGVDSMYIVADVTETAESTLTQSVNIEIGANVTWTLGEFYLDVNNVVDVEVAIKGHSNSTMVYESTASSALIRNCVASTVQRISNLHFQNASTANSAELSDEGIIKMDNCVISLPDVHSCGIALRYNDAYADNVKVIGGGSSCWSGIQCLLGSVSNISVWGDWNASNAAITVDGNCVGTNIIREESNVGEWKLEVNGTVSNVSGETGCNVDCGDQAQLSNAQGLKTLDTLTSDNVSLSNVRCNAFVSSLPSAFLQVNNMVIQTDSNFNVQDSMIVGLKTPTDVTIGIGSQNNTFTNCRLGNEALGTAHFELLNGCDYLTMDNCIFESTVVNNSGGGTALRYTTATFNVCNAVFSGAVV